MSVSFIILTGAGIYQVRAELDDIRSSRDALETERSEEYRYGRKLSVIEKDVAIGIKHVMSSLAQACIEHRNADSKAEIQKLFLSAQKSYQSSRVKVKPLAVLPISTKSFASLERKQQVHGFPTLKSTGVPSLKNFFTEATLEVRRKNATAFLKEFQGLRCMMQQWAMTTEPPYKLSDTTLETIRKIVDDQLGDTGTLTQASR